MAHTELRKADNLFDFFHERVDAAVAHQHANVSREGVYYLANLLVEKGRVSEEEGPGTLVELHLQASAGDRAQQIRSYREIGDRALYLSGFFRRSVERGLVSLEYYLHMGASAYSALASALCAPRGVRKGSLEEVFDELACRFEACSEVLREVEAEVRTEGEARSDRDILRLYERWLETGSPALARRLQELGVIPMRRKGDGGE